MKKLNKFLFGQTKNNYYLQTTNNFCLQKSFSLVMGHNHSIHLLRVWTWDHSNRFSGRSTYFIILLCGFLKSRSTNQSPDAWPDSLDLGSLKFINISVDLHILFIMWLSQSPNRDRPPYARDSVQCDNVLKTEAHLFCR